MSETVAEFMSKKDVKRFASGVKSKVVKALASTAVLAAAFGAYSDLAKPEPPMMDVQTTYAVTEQGDTLCAYQAIPVNASSYERLQKLVNSATKSETGREVLKAIAEQGTVLRVDKAGSNTLGFFNPGDNSICLNKAFSDKSLQSTLIHEGRHSMQNVLSPANEGACTFASNVMSNRVKEADATAIQTKFAFEMAEQGDYLAWHDLLASHYNIAKTYENAGKKYGANSDQAMKETMLSWYKDKKYVGQYDDLYIDFHASVVKNVSADTLQYCFSKTQDMDDVLTAVCSWKGHSYAGTDGSILKTPETAYLSSDGYVRITSVSEALSAKTQGKRSDESADCFYVMKNGKVLNCTYKQLMDGAKSQTQSVSKSQLRAQNDSVKPMTTAQLMTHHTQQR